MQITVGKDGKKKWTVLKAEERCLENAAALLGVLGELGLPGAAEASVAVHTIAGVVKKKEVSQAPTLPGIEGGT